MGDAGTQGLRRLPRLLLISKWPTAYYVRISGCDQRRIAILKEVAADLRGLRNADLRRTANL
jgi:hypothetical protein